MGTHPCSLGRSRRQHEARTARCCAIWPNALRTAYYFSSRDRRRSASGLPPVWQVGQYCSDESANDTSRTVSPQTGHGWPVAAVHPQVRLLLGLQLARIEFGGPPNGVPQCRLHGFVEDRHLVGGEAVGDLERRHLGDVQNLVAVGVADARDHRLVTQQPLDLHAPAMQQRRQCVDVERRVKRLGTQPGNALDRRGVENHIRSKAFLGAGLGQIEARAVVEFHPQRDRTLARPDRRRARAQPAIAANQHEQDGRRGAGQSSRYRGTSHAGSRR